MSVHAVPNIALLVGSLRKDSLNQALGRALVNVFGGRARCTQVEIGGLPHFNEDDEVDAPFAVTQFRQQIAAADLLIFVTPEYNRSVSGVLKNAIDQGSRPKGKSVWRRKPAGVIGCSPGALGTCMAQQHLRNILSALDVRVMGQPEAYIQARTGAMQADGRVDDPALRQFLEQWCAALLAFAIDC